MQFIHNFESYQSFVQFHYRYFANISILFKLLYEKEKKGDEMETSHLYKATDTLGRFSRNHGNSHQS